MAACRDHAYAPPETLRGRLYGYAKRMLRRLYPVNLENYYDGFAKNYDEVCRRQYAYAIPQKVEEWAVTLAGKNVSLLDLGCGTGLIAKSLKTAGVQGDWWAIDISQEMLNRAMSQGLYSKSVKWDLNKGLPPIGPHRFSLITACGCLEFIRPIKTILKNIASALDPEGGEVWLTLEKSAPDSPPHGMVDPVTGWTRWHWSEVQARQLLEQAGLEIKALIDMQAHTNTATGCHVRYFFVVARRSPGVRASGAA